MRQIKIEKALRCSELLERVGRIYQGKKERLTGKNSRKQGNSGREVAMLPLTKDEDLDGHRKQIRAAPPIIAI
jgi:hypothetical protein